VLEKPTFAPFNEKVFYCWDGCCSSFLAFYGVATSRSIETGHQKELDRQMDEQAISLHRQHPDWTIEQIAGAIASNTSRPAVIGSLVTAFVAVVLYALISSFFGERWWHLAVVFALWLAGIICIAIT
jgi:hypothetical protein